MRLVRAALAVFAVLSAGTPSVLNAQGIDRSVDRIGAALHDQSQLRLSAPTWTVPPLTTLGVLTFVPPTSSGEMVRVRLPIGELVSRTAQGLARANRRRREAAARREVHAALAAFASQPKAP